MRPLLCVVQDGSDLSELEDHLPGSKSGYGVRICKLNGDYIVTEVAAMIATPIWSIWFGEHPNQYTHEEMASLLNRENIIFRKVKGGIEVPLKFVVKYID